MAGFFKALAETAGTIQMPVYKRKHFALPCLIMALFLLAALCLGGGFALASDPNQVLEQTEVPLGRLLGGPGDEPASEVKLSASQLYQKVAPTVVTIVNQAGGKYLSHGSGFLVSSGGLVLTNHHVVQKEGPGGTPVEQIVVTASGQRLPAKPVRSDPGQDLAVLKVPGNNHPYARLGDSSALKVGQKIFILGTPVRLEFRSTLTEGMISGVERSRGRLQTSAILHGGNSGGPAFDTRGRAVAVAVAVATLTDHKTALVGQKKVVEMTTREAAHGLSYLIPINKAKKLLSK